MIWVINPFIPPLGAPLLRTPTRGIVITNVGVALHVDDELNNCPTPYMELNKSARTSQTGQTGQTTDR